MWRGENEDQNREAAEETPCEGLRLAPADEGSPSATLRMTRGPRPGARRGARRAGRLSAKIRSCAAFRLYGVRWKWMTWASVSKRAKAARQSPSRGCPT